MSDFPLISVIIPTYNRGYCIKKSIESVLNQTYPNIEVIVVDDCSTDNTEEIIKSCSDVRVCYIKLDRNGGPAKARNVGLKAARGQFAAFQDSDDIWHSDKLEKQYAVMIDDKACQLVFCKYEIAGQELVVPRDDSFDVSQCEHGMLDILLNEPKVGTPTMLVRMSAIRAVGEFNDSLRTKEDWEFSLRVARFGGLKFLNEVLVDVCQSNDSVNHITGKERLDVYIVILGLYWKIYKEKKVFLMLFKRFFADYEFLSDVDKTLYIDRLLAVTPAASLLLAHIQEAKENYRLLENHAQFLEKQIYELKNKLNNSLPRERYKKEMIKRLTLSFCSGLLKTRFSMELDTRFSLYGAGEVARALIPLCKKIGITILFTIDKKPKVIEDVMSYTISQIPDKSIPIVITAYDPERMLKSELEEKIFAPAFYLDDLLAI